MQNTVLDQYIQRLQNIQPFNVYQVGDDGSAKAWYEVDGAIVQELVLKEYALAAQVSSIASQIMHWGRMASQARRVWEIAEREYRVWRSKKVLELVTPPIDPDEKKGWKKPTESVIDATYRADPEYRTHQCAIERAEEAYNASLAIVDGFKAKRDMLKIAVMRSHENGQPRMSI